MVVDDTSKLTRRFDEIYLPSIFATGYELFSRGGEVGESEATDMQSTELEELCNQQIVLRKS